MSTKRRTPTKVEGVGFVGRWDDGTLGWSMPAYLTGYARQIEKPPEGRSWNKHYPHYRCKITIELLPDKNGRPVVYYPGGKAKR